MTLQKGFQLAALVLAVLGIIIPILGWLGLALACVAAVRGDRALAIATVGVSAAGFIFVSLFVERAQSDEALPWSFIIYYSNFVLMAAVIGCILLYPKLKKATTNSESRRFTTD